MKSEPFLATTMKSEIPAISAARIPQLLWCVWDEHDEEERIQHRRHRWRDIIGLFVMMLGYLAFASCAATRTNVAAAAPAVQVLQFMLCAVALYNLHLQVFALPKVAKEAGDAYFVCGGPLGRWIFMTHQSIGLVAIHFVLSTVAPQVGQGLLVATYLTAVPIGGLAVFVTVQFFLLVYSHPDCVKEYRVWAARGVHFELIDIVRHTPPGFLALMDVCVLKERALLTSVMPSLPALVLINLVYASAYIVLVHANERITGYWPYGLCKDLEYSWAKWSKFACMQGGILSLFAASLWLLARWTPSIW